MKPLVVLIIELQVRKLRMVMVGSGEGREGCQRTGYT